MPRCRQTSAFGLLRESRSEVLEHHRDKWLTVTAGRAFNALFRRPEWQPLAEPPRVSSLVGGKVAPTAGANDCQGANLVTELRLDPATGRLLRLACLEPSSGHTAARLPPS